MALTMAVLLQGAVTIDGESVTFTLTDTRATEVAVNIMREDCEEDILTLPLGREGKAAWSATLSLPEGSYTYMLSASYDGGGSHVTGYDRESAFAYDDRVSRFSVRREL